jgi:hypothetical protein
MIFIFLAMLIICCVWPNNADRQFFQVFAGLILINILIAYRFLKIHWSVALAFLMVSVTSLVVITFPQVYHQTLDPAWTLKLIAIMEQGYFVFLLIAILPLLLAPEFFKAALGALLIAAILDSVLIIGRTIIWGFSQSYAFLGNSAMDAAFIATMLPLVFWGLQIKFFKGRLLTFGPMVIMLVAIILTKSSTGIMGVGVALASYLFIQYRAKALFAIIPAALGISGLSYLYLGQELLNPNGRYYIWWIATKFFADNANPIWGAGPNSFFFWGPEIQRGDMISRHVAAGTPYMAFYWMHNDWLQTFFENGALGFLALLLLFLCLLKFSWAKKNALFAIICTYASVMLTQMPFHLWPFQILGVSLVVLTFSKESLKI